MLPIQILNKNIYSKHITLLQYNIILILLQLRFDQYSILIQIQFISFLNV